MTNSYKLSSLNYLLALDAATCAAMGVILMLGSVPIAGLTQIPTGLLFWAGGSLIPTSAFMAVSSRSMPVPSWAATIVIFGNLLWVTASICLPAVGLIVPNVLGWTFLIGQAVVIAILAMLEFNALRGRAVTV